MEMSKQGEGTADHILPLGEWFKKWAPVNTHWWAGVNFKSSTPPSPAFHLIASEIQSFMNIFLWEAAGTCGIVCV